MTILNTESIFEASLNKGACIIKLKDIYDFLETHPTILADMETFNDLMFFDIQTSFEERYDWLHPEKEPKEFIIFLRKLEKFVIEPDYKIAVTEFIEFFEWTKWSINLESS